MIDLLKSASDALIANDAMTLERLAEDASREAAGVRTATAATPAAGIGPAAEVLRRQVMAASMQLATRRRLSATSGPQANPWAR